MSCNVLFLCTANSARSIISEALVEGSEEQRREAFAEALRVLRRRVQELTRLRSMHFRTNHV